MVRGVFGPKYFASPADDYFGLGYAARPESDGAWRLPSRCSYRFCLECAGCTTRCGDNAVFVQKIPTHYGGVPGFVKAATDDGAVLYIENVEMHPCELLRALWSLRLHDWFDGLRGILIGRNAAADAKQANDLNYLDALRSACEGISCPVLYDLDIGHLPPQLSLVNGALAQVSFEGDSGSIKQSLGS